MKLSTYLFKTAEEAHQFGVWLRKKLGLPAHASLAGPGAPRLGSLANVAEGFHPGGLKTFYPTDDPYTTRFLLVAQATSADGDATTLNSSYGISYDDMCKKSPITRLLVPLGICTDEPGNGDIDTEPISTNVALLGSGLGATLQGVGDAVLTPSTILTQSGTTAGYLGALSSTAGAYYTVGIALSTSEGAGYPVEFDPRPAWLAVQVQT